MLSFKYYKTSWLIPVILILAAGLDFAIVEWLIPVLKERDMDFLRAPTNVALITGFLKVYDKYLWRFKGLNFLVNVPNMSGRYKGCVKYEWDKKKEKKPCFIEIKQTASKIKINGYFNDDNEESTDSYSLVEDIRLGEDTFYWIYFFYTNGGHKINATLDDHEGANVFKYLPAEIGGKAKLKGYYFTNRTVQTRGAIEAEYETNKLKGTF
ncbi:hypothetical protein MTsPCn9_10280 [Croceitalea sp. MTPC9]|uniref:Cap15 family cyclic dinucleotide receptor domain-containing protein n=1 Tax=unclassified Croceitalea TaxID=2632280 RepID=UPI002B36AD7B|nr:hypothetical protein MTsPCn6_26960 [Croceitalea sp. MTPC6]GMN16092.1 hypothetical protein MTsPCn9_10280 [Croceitalea sp. MTPC9]